MRQLTDQDITDAMHNLADRIRDNTLEAAARVAKLYGAPDEACRRILMLKGRPGSEG